jgi:hypothetical protein
MTGVEYSSNRGLVKATSVRLLLDEYANVPRLFPTAYVLFLRHELCKVAVPNIPRS